MKKMLVLLAVGCLMAQNSVITEAKVPNSGDIGGQSLKNTQDVENYLQRQKQTQQEKPQIANKLPAEAGQDNSAQAIKFLVSSIVTDTSAIFSAQELNQLMAISEPHEMTLADLYAVVSKINAAYKQKGYPASKAIIPQQNIKDGIVHLRLVEGRYGRFIVKNSKHWREKYIKDQLLIKPGELVNAKKLELALLNFNTNNEARLQAELTAGQDFGLTDCILDVTEPKEWQGAVFTDNTNVDTSGKYRLGVQVVNTNLGGNGERIFLSPVWTKGTLSGLFSFDAPLGLGGTRFRTGYSRNRVKIIDGIYENLGIRGNSSDLYFGFTMPIDQSFNGNIQGFLTFHHKKSYSDIYDFVNYDTTSNTFDLGANFHRYDSRGGWYGELSATLIKTNDNLQEDGGRTLRRFDLNLMRQQLLGHEQTLTFRFLGQTTNDKNLPVTEQITLGGLYSMRGFPDSYVNGDSGYYTNLEYEFPLASRMGLRGITFLDYGQVINRYADVSLRRELFSSGIGLVYNKHNIYGRLVWGFPLKTSGELAKGNPRLHFYLQYGF